MSKQNRDRSSESRAFDNRELDSRNAEQNEFLAMDCDDPLHIPAHIIPSGVRYYWVRESVYDKPDDSRYSMMRRKGWSPVPSSRHPELMIPETYERRALYNGFFFHGGLVLCERSEELCLRDEAKRREQDRAVLKSLPGYDALKVDPSIPVSGNHNVYMTKEGGGNSRFMGDL